MFTLDQTDCRSITAPLSLSLFLASQATTFSHLRFRFPHHHHSHHNSSRKPVLAHPLRSTVHFSTPSRFPHTPLKLTHTKHTHINKLKVSACSHDSIPLTDRLISAATYSLPLLDGLGYGFSRVLPYQYPQIFHLYRSTDPLTRYLVFYAIFIFVIQNPKFNKYVRLNAVQALLLSQLLQLPGLGFRTIISPVWPQLMVICCDFMFFVTVFGFVYSMVKIILRETPEFPLVTDAAAIHVRLL